MRSAIFKTIEPEVRAVDAKTRTIWHPITREVPDRVGDIIELDGIDLKNFSRKPSVLYGHEYQGKDPVPVIAENIGFRRDGDTLVAGTRFLNPKEVSSKLADLVTDIWYLNTKKLMGWSVGFIPNLDKVENITDSKDRVIGRRFKEAELLEYSSVIIPCHQDAINNAVAKGILSESFELPFVGDVAVETGGGRTFFCRELPEARVPAFLVKAAVDALRYCGRQLRLKDTIELVWFRLADPGEAGGKILGPRPVKAFVLLGGEPKVYLRTDLSLAQLEFCAAHELHHVWFERQPGHANPEREALRENAADAFAFLMTMDLRKKREEAEGIAEVMRLHAASQGSLAPRWKKGPDGRWERM